MNAFNSDSRNTSRRALQVRGLSAVAGMVTLAWLAHASYTKQFGDPVMVELTSDRAGLLLEPGADVALRNVDIGEVRGVRAVRDGAVIELALDAGEAERIEAASAARIVSPTLLGPKYVEIVPTADPGTSRGLRDGDLIAASQVQIEANAAFEDLISVLDGIRPAQLNTALGAISTTLQGRGQQLGDYLVQADAYLARFNRALPTMERDMALAAEVSRVYARLAPDLLAVLDAATTTGETLVDRADALDALLVSIQRTSDTTRTFLAHNRVPLRRAMDLLRPSTTTMARFAPIFPCLFESLNDYRTSVEPASGGVYPGLWVHLSVLPGADPYDAATDLPIVRADQPSCSGGPMGLHGHYRPVDYDDGAPATDNTDAPITSQENPLFVQLFGQSIGAPGREASR